MSYFDRNNEKDDFWDIEKLVPKKKSTLSPFSTSAAVRDFTAPIPESKPTSCSADGSAPDTVLISAGENSEQISTQSGSSESKLTFEGMRGVGATEDRTYCPENSLIKSITIKKPLENYDFYDSFRRAAILYYDCPGTKSPFAQFYSYMPQYSQLTKPQKDYYFYWRSELRRGNYIKTDYSYLYLYVYEIINLPDIITSNEGICILCKLWKAYRSDLPRIDMYFSIWVRDYCLVHDLPCPFSEIADFIFDVIRISDFKEYYFGDLGNSVGSGVWMMLAYLSDYDWHKGFYSVVGKDADNPEQAEKARIYKSLLEGAMRMILPSVWDICLKETESGATAKISRSAFPNTLCTHSVKCKLEIEYYPLADSSAIREGITAAVRYTENKLRSLFGVKSRIAVKEISPVYANLIDTYFATLIRKTEKAVKQRNMPEYEKLYDAPGEALSFSGADEIERQSWDVTLRLCDTEDYIEYASDRNVADATPVQTDISADTDGNGEDSEDLFVNGGSEGKADSCVNCLGVTDTASDNTESGVESEVVSAEAYGLSPDEIKYIFALCRGETAVFGDLPEESLVERINEAFSDGFGDIIIEHDGSKYVIIEDYKEEITEWLKKF